MRGVTHAWAGVFVGCALSAYWSVDPATAAFGGVVAIVASELPDMVSPIIPFIKVKTFEGHRAVTHWLLTAVATTYVVYTLRPGLWQYWLAGYLSHLLLDAITFTGIYAFGPLPVVVRLGRCRNGGVVDQLLERALPLASVTLAVMWVVTLVAGGVG